jgi:DNA-binding transcriptional MerR regulator
MCGFRQQPSVALTGPESCDALEQAAGSRQQAAGSTGRLTRESRDALGYDRRRAPGSGLRTSIDSVTYHCYYAIGEEGAVERNSQTDERQYTLQELADSAGVSIRTIRYYIGEGLLPGPDGAGPQSHYTQSHAKRLQVIALLKDRFLPLKEIRKQLAGLDDTAIDRLIIDLDGDELDGLADTHEPAAAPARAADADEQAFRIDAPPKYDARALHYIDSALTRGPSRFRGIREGRGRMRSGERDEGERWRRIEVVDGVELLVREETYQRRRDRIDWLIDWARKVVD